jgi:uncharacterized membrane protein
MKKNTFYLICGCIAVILLAIFWYSDEIHAPIFIEVAFVIAVAIIYCTRRQVKDLIEDERGAKITEKAALRTLQISWVIFCAFSIGAIMQLLRVPTFSRKDGVWHPPEVSPLNAILPLRAIGYIQLGILCLMIFLYVGFRLYYARKYGDWETDEE